MKQNKLTLTRTPNNIEVYMELKELWGDLADFLDLWYRREMKCCPHVHMSLVRHVSKICTVDISADKGHETELDLYERLLRS